MNQVAKHGIDEAAVELRFQRFLAARRHYMDGHIGSRRFRLSMMYQAAIVFAGRPFDYNGPPDPETQVIKEIIRLRAENRALRRVVAGSESPPCDEQTPPSKHSGPDQRQRPPARSPGKALAPGHD